MSSCGTGQLDDCDDCVQVIRDTKTVEVPCTVNTYKQYTVKVPRQVTQQIEKTVNYTDYETRQKQVPYTVNRSERRIRMETQKYQVPVTKYYKKTTMETRERQVPVPYYVNVPITKYHTLTETVPVQRNKIEMDNVVKTVWETEKRTRCVPVTTIVKKQIPVYHVVPKRPGPCPPNTDCHGRMINSSGQGQIDTKMENIQKDDEKAVHVSDTDDRQVDGYMTATSSSNLPKLPDTRPTYLE